MGFCEVETAKAPVTSTDNGLLEEVSYHEKRPRYRGLFSRRWSERSLLRPRVDWRVVRHLLFPGPVELADGIRLHLPSLERPRRRVRGRYGDLALAFAELLLVGAAQVKCDREAINSVPST